MCGAFTTQLHAILLLVLSLAYHTRAYVQNWITKPGIIQQTKTYSTMHGRDTQLIRVSKHVNGMENKMTK
jgi:hypothetical protein